MHQGCAFASKAVPNGAAGRATMSRNQKSSWSQSSRSSAAPPPFPSRSSCPFSSFLVRWRPAEALPEREFAMEVSHRLENHIRQVSDRGFNFQRFRVRAWKKNHRLNLRCEIYRAPTGRRKTNEMGGDRRPSPRLHGKSDILGPVGSPVGSMFHFWCPVLV